MESWQKEILARYGSSEALEEPTFEDELNRFSERMAMMASRIDPKRINSMKLKEPCLPCLKHRR